MAILDSTLNFSTAQAITTTAASTNLYDITGAGAGNAPVMVGGLGANTALGVDIFAGDGQAKPIVEVSVTTTGTGAGTITILLQSAPDNGSFSPGTYTTIGSTQAFVGTSLVAGQQILIAGNPLPPLEALPRFYRLDYVVSGSATASFTANLVMNAPTFRQSTLYPKNYVVA